MSDNAKSIAVLDLLAGTAEKLAAVQELGWHVGKLREYAKGLFERAPFRVGDRVRLTKTPEITKEKAWGWLAAKHYLIKGAEGLVHEVDFHDGLFQASIFVDDETWIDSEGEKHPCTEKHLYCFWEGQIERVEKLGLTAAKESET
jgi:hypothetical protein